MGRRGIAAIFSKLVDSPGAGASASASPPWPWPSCRGNPQTSSFRGGGGDDGPCCTTAGAGGAVAGGGEMYKTVNSVYLDYSGDGSCFGDDVVDVDDDSFSTTTASEEWSEAVIRSLGRTSTDRFFFDPGPASNSILPAGASPETKLPALSVSPSPAKTMVEESVAVAVDSEDPYGDFRASMEEMVAAHGLRGWDALEELLVWYLRINGKHNHALIVGAFVDLLVGLASPPSAAASITPTTTATATSATTTTTSSTSTSSASGGAAAATATAEQCPSSPSHQDVDGEVNAAVAGDEEEDNPSDRRHIGVEPHLQLLDLLHAS